MPDDSNGIAGVPFLAKPYRPSELVDIVHDTCSIAKLLVRRPKL